MIEKAVIRIGCILLSLVVLTGCVIYLSSDNINRPYYEKKRTKATNHPFMQQNNQNVDIEDTPETEKNTRKKIEQKDNVDDTIDQDDNSIEMKNDTDYTTHETEISSNNTKKPLYVECEIPDAIVSFSKGSSSISQSSSQTVSSNIIQSSSDTDSSSSQNSSQGNTSSSKPQQIITTETNNDIAVSIIKTYGIKVIIARSSKDYENQNIISYVQDEYEIYQNLLAVSRYLALLNQGFLADFDIEKIILVEEHCKKTAVMLASQDMILSCKKQSLPNDIKCEVNHILTRYIVEKIDKDSFKGSLAVYNPTQFTYGFVTKEYICTEKNFFYGYFLNEKAQLSEIDDATELCYFILSNPKELVRISKESNIYPKLVEICEIIKKQYPSYNKNILKQS